MTNASLLDRKARAFSSCGEMLLVTLLLSSLATTTSRAEVVRDFGVRYQTNERGDIVLIGNTLLTCPTSGLRGQANSVCLAVQRGESTELDNNGFVMTNVDVDDDPTTIRASSADLSLPMGAQVLFAELVWQAFLPGRADGGVVKLRVPGASTYASVRGAVDVGSDVGNGHVFYQGHVDVTAAVMAAGAGTYAVADVPAVLGLDGFAGWALVVVYRDESKPLRNLTVFDGLAAVGNEQDRGGDVAITVSGFLTPSLGPVNTTVGVVAGEGDRKVRNDVILVDGVELDDGMGDVFNFFNGSITQRGNVVTSKDPDYRNQLGFDIDVVNAAGILSNGSSSALVELLTRDGGDRYFPGVLTFVTDVYAPLLSPTFVMSFDDATGGVVEPKDLLDYRLSVGNTGDDAALDVVIEAPIPPRTTYVAGTSSIALRAPGADAAADASACDVSQTDAADDDAVEVDDVRRRVVFHVGRDAATPRGQLAVGGVARLCFRVRIDDDVEDGVSIESQANVHYTSTAVQAMAIDLSDDPRVPGRQPTRFAVARVDQDRDGVTDADEVGATLLDRIDTDDDGTPDIDDVDDDGDGIDTAQEVDDERLFGDGDDDHVPARRDLDSDDDGVTDAIEGRADRNGDGVPDYLDAGHGQRSAPGEGGASSSTAGTSARLWQDWVPAGGGCACDDTGVDVLDVGLCAWGVLACVGRRRRTPRGAP